MPPPAPIETEPTLSRRPTEAMPAAGPPHANTPPKRVRRRGGLLVLPSARTGEGKRLREFRIGLIAHVGRPSLVQLALIDRATVLQHHLTTFDRKAAADGGMSDHTTRVYLAWQNTLTRTLAQLGMKGAPTPVPTLAEHLARRAAEARATATAAPGAAT